MHGYSAIVIGVSAGGMNALKTILSVLPANFSLPIIIVQHMAADSDSYLISYLNERSSVKVKMAEIREEIKGNTVYIAPPAYHLLIEDDYTFSFTADPYVNYARPSIDVLFETAASAYGSQLVGIILTGANSDGSKGLKDIKDYGGLTLVQDPKTAESDCMPLSAINTVDVDYILNLDEIGPFLKREFHDNL
ncbi:MAG: chemotaxis protein CheB [bacterium]